MEIFVLGNFIDGSIYHRDRNEETRSTIVSDVGEVTGAGQATVAPLNQALCASTGSGGCGWWGKVTRRTTNGVEA